MMVMVVIPLLIMMVHTSVNESMREMWTMHAEMMLNEPEAVIRFTICTECLSEHTSANLNLTEILHGYSMLAEKIHKSMVMAGCISLMLHEYDNGNLVWYGDKMTMSRVVVTIRTAEIKH